MTRRLVNALLLGSVGVLFVTGSFGWLLPDPQATPLYPIHRGAGVALAVLLVWKWSIALASLRRRVPARDASAVVGLMTASTLLTSVGLGVAWSVGLITFDRPIPYSLLNLHVFAGAALIPFVVWHALLRRDAPPRRLPLATRRGALRAIAIGAAGIALAAAIDLVAPLRRHTGSKHAGSFSANDFPLTIWAFDSVPAIDRGAWSVAVMGAVARPLRLDYDALTAFTYRETVAVLDCTGGWWSEQVWRGVPVVAVLEASGALASARAVDVVSVTGHRWSFARADLANALLATHVGDETLTAGHGYPVRLVVPGRRGYQWVKWVDRLEVS